MSETCSSIEIELNGESSQERAVVADSESRDPEELSRIVNVVFVADLGV